jgi:hypothetical protein
MDEVREAVFTEALGSKPIEGVDIPLRTFNKSYAKQTQLLSVEQVKH